MFRDESFFGKYARAKSAQMCILADETLDIANTPEPGEVVTIKADGTDERRIADMIEHRRLKIDTRKWLAGKLAPKIFGERIQQEISMDEGLAASLIEARKRAEGK